ncbi:uncharacterized [Tachysurus ichikawai]
MSLVVADLLSALKLQHVRRNELLLLFRIRGVVDRLPSSEKLISESVGNEGQWDVSYKACCRLRVGVLWSLSSETLVLFVYG